MVTYLTNSAEFVVKYKCNYPENATFMKSSFPDAPKKEAEVCTNLLKQIEKGAVLQSETRLTVLQLKREAR